MYGREAECTQHLNLLRSGYILHSTNYYYNTVAVWILYHTSFCEQKEQHLRFYAILPVSYLHRFTVQTHEGKPVSEEERRVITLVQLMPVIHEQGSRAVAYCMAPLTKATSSGEDAMYPVCSACWECPPSSPSIWSPSISSGPASFTCTVWHRHRARRKSSSFS